jgi:hypothetical protein
LTAFETSRDQHRRAAERRILPAMPENIWLLRTAPRCGFDSSHGNIVPLARGQSVPRPAERRRYADAPAAALLTGLAAGERPPLKWLRPYAPFSLGRPIAERALNALLGFPRLPLDSPRGNALVRWFSIRLRREVPTSDQFLVATGSEEQRMTNQISDWIDGRPNSEYGRLRPDGSQARIRGIRHGDTTMRKSDDPTLPDCDDYIASALVPKAAISRSVAALCGAPHNGGSTLYFAHGARLSGYDCEQVKACCIAAGLPVIDSRMVPFEDIARLAVNGPMVAVGETASPPPYHALSYTLLAVLANAYRAAEAEVFNIAGSVTAETPGE